MKCDTCPTRIEGVFCSLPPDRLQDLDRCKKDNIVKKGQVLFDEGTPAQGVYCVFEGQLKLFKTGDQGRPQIIGIAKEGALVGHRAVLLDKPHSFTAEALVDSRICFVDKPTFSRMVIANSGVAQSLLKRLAQDLDAAENRLLDQVEKPVPVRLARLLLTLKSLYGRPVKKGTEITIHLTREEMAEMIGTTQETTIRLLSGFKKNGWVRLDHKSITLVDTAGLEDVASSQHA